MYSQGCSGQRAPLSPRRLQVPLTGPPEAADPHASQTLAQRLEEAEEEEVYTGVLY